MHHLWRLVQYWLIYVEYLPMISVFFQSEVILSNTCCIHFNIPLSAFQQHLLQTYCNRIMWLYMGEYQKLSKMISQFWKEIYGRFPFSWLWIVDHSDSWVQESRELWDCATFFLWWWESNIITSDIIWYCFLYYRGGMRFRGCQWLWASWKKYWREYSVGLMYRKAIQSSCTCHFGLPSQPPSVLAYAVVDVELNVWRSHLLTVPIGALYYIVWIT